MTDLPSISDAREQRHASWLELFYDLLFVALFAQLAHGLVHDLRATTALHALGLFAPAWWAWVSTTFSTNIFGESGPAHRLLTLANMACLLLMTGGVTSALDGDPELYAAGFAASRLVLLALVAAWHLRQPGASPPVASYTVYSLSAALWGLSIVVGTPAAYGLWAVSVGVELAVRLREQTIARQAADGMSPFHVDLLIERFGLLVIVALGEGVVQIATALNSVERSTSVIISALAAFAILAGLWSSYFAFASNVITTAFRNQPQRAFELARDGFVFGHFALVGAIVVLSAGLGATVTAAATDDSLSAGLWLLGDGLAVYLISIVAISRRLARPQRN